MDEELQMLDPNSRRPQNTWTREERVILCLLYRFYHKDYHAFKEVFNSIFRDELSQCGLETGLLYRVLNTQWEDMKRHGNPIWHEVHIQSAFNRHGVYSKRLQKIEITADLLGLTLEPKDHDDIDITTFVLKFPRSNSSGLDLVDLTQNPEGTPAEQTVNAGPSHNHESAENLALPMIIEDDEDPVLTEGETRMCAGQRCFWCHREGLLEFQADSLDCILPEPAELQPTLQLPGHDLTSLANPQQTPRAIDTGLPTPGLSNCNWSQQSPDSASGVTIPRIIYRWSNIDSMGINSKQLFLAGLFAAGAPNKSPDEYSAEEFKQIVMHHVRINEVLTPFISTFEAPLSPIHRALHRQEGAIVAIIDSSKITTPIYSAKALVYNMAIRQSRYDGRREYLVWGKIPNEAIVACFKINELQTIVAQDTDIGDILQLEQLLKRGLRDRTPLGTVVQNKAVRLSYQSGLAVGKLLRSLGVPQIYGEEIATSISRSWQFNRRGFWQEYIQGVEEAFGALVSPQLRTVSRSLNPTRTSATPVSNAISVGQEVIVLDSDADSEPPSPAPTPCPTRDRGGATNIFTSPIMRTPRRRVEFVNTDVQEWSSQENQMSHVQDDYHFLEEPEHSATRSSNTTTDEVDIDDDLLFMGENARGPSNSGQNDNTRHTDQFNSDRARVLHFLGSN